MTDSRNAHNDPILALKLNIADINAERRRLATKRFTAPADKQPAIIERMLKLDKQILVMRAQLRETLKDLGYA